MPETTLQLWPVIPTQGRAAQLRQQLARLVKQLRHGEHVVVVADGCTDGAATAREFGAAVETVQIAHMGVDRARVLGAALVPGDAVLVEVDDHDLVEPCFLDELRAAFADPAVVAAYCDVYLTDPKGRARTIKIKHDDKLGMKGNVGYGMRAYRKWAYDMVGGYPTEYFPANDYALLCKMEQAFGRDALYHIRKPLLTVVEDHTGVSGQNKDTQQRQVEVVANIMLNGGFPLPVRVTGKPAHVVNAQPPATATRGVARRIPKILHFVWVGPPMPEWAAANIERFKALNPDYVVLRHGEEVLLPGWKKTYAKIDGEHLYSRKSDLLRVSALVKFGGWYFDCDFLPFRPLADVLRDYDGVPTGFMLTQGTPALVANGIIGAAVGSEMLEVVRQAIDAMCATGESEQAWGAYGPALYTRLAKQHAGAFSLGDIEMFYPLRERENAQWVYKKLAAAKFSEQSVLDAFGRVPYMLHLSMMDALTLAE